MKRSYIFAFVVIALAVVVIVSTSGSASKYVGFEEARTLYDNGSDKSVHVVGELKRTPAGEFTGIEEASNKMNFEFILVDENNREEKVFYNNPMPADFLKSEKVVVIGKYYNTDRFYAEKILLKCPSKYQEETDEISASL